VSALELPAPAPMSRGRRWLFRLVAAGLGPLLLVVAELILRASGFGHPTSFFLPRQIAGQSVLVENPWFGFSYFAPAQARSPSPLIVPNPKPDGVCRIFLFGESAAMGDPRPAYGMGRCLESLLRARFPERQFEVVCAGMTAINSHGLLPIARECARRQGDLWIIYTGHNEFVGPFGANTVFGPAVPARSIVRAYLALERTRTGQWLVALARRLKERGRSPASWGGMRVFLDQQVSPADPRKARVYASFRSNMEDILRAARRVGVPVLLSTAASNLKDCAPFASVHAPPLQAEKQAEWKSRFQTGQTNLRRGDFAGAELSPLYAEGQFRLAQCLLEKNQTNAAAQAYRQARDADALPFRASTVINQIIRDLAARHARKGVTFLDAGAVLAPLSASRITGEESFLEHVHLNFEGNYAVARAMAEKAVTVLPRRLLGRENPSWEDASACARDLAFTDWNRCTILEDIEQRITDAPFTNQADHAVSLRKLESQLAECKARLQRQAIPGAREVYEQAIQRRPKDHWLHHNYAEFLAAIGDLPQAAEQMRIVCDLAPQHQSAQLHLGRLLAHQGRFEEAAKAFQAALAIRPDSGPVYMELGQARANQGRFGEALQAYSLAQRFNVDPVRVCVLRAQLFRKQDKLAEALRSLREAIQLRPEDWDLHDRLGAELVLQGKFHDAEIEFAAALRLRPDSAETHFNLGIALARQDRFDEALAQLETAARLEPRNRKVREFIEAIRQRQRAASGR
jgi:tetratricopeptide (TPR) repeat protein